MKTKSTHVKHAAFAALLLGLSPALVAESSGAKRQTQGSQNQSSQNQTGQSQNQSAQSQRQSGSGQMQLRQAPEDPRGRYASEIIGMEVFGSGGEELGNVHDFVIDSQSGKIAHVVVASGGVLGIGSNLRPVPIAACNLSGERVTLNVDQQKWEQAPVFTAEQLASLNQDTRKQEIYQFYGQKDPSQGKKNQQFALVTNLRGKEVQSRNQEVGEIEDVILQLKSKTAAALLDPNDDFAGTDQKFIVPLNKLNNLQQETIGTQLTQQDFSRAAPASDDTWSGGTDGYVSTLYIWPVYLSGQDTAMSGNTSGSQQRSQQQQQSQAGNRQRNQSDSQSQASAGQGQPPVDAVRRAVQAEASQQDIRVVAEQNKVVLRGTVQSEAQKERIENRAESAAQGWDVESQLRVAANQ